MKTRNPEAARLEKDYWDRLEESIRHLEREDAEEIRQGVEEHIEEALSDTLSDEVSLVQMAEVLERLGAPETYAKETSEQSSQPTLGASSTHQQAVSLSTPPQSENADLQQDKAGWCKFLDKLWMALLVGVVGLYIPIFDVYFCSIISTIMLIFALKSDIVVKSNELSGIGKIATALIAVLCISPITATLSLVHPLFEILNLPIAIALTVIQLVLFWKIMTGLGELVTTYSREDIAEKIYSARQLYIILTLVLIGVGMIVGVIFVLTIGGVDKKASLMVEIIAGVASLPFSWLVGWFFYLRPVSMAKTALK